MSHAQHDALTEHRDAIVRQLLRLHDLLEAGTCPIPTMTTALDWANPVWWDQWMRSHPDLIRQEIALNERLLTEATALLDRRNNR